MSEKETKHLISLATADQPPRVWSLLVSLFGDLAQGTDDQLRSQTLNQIMGAIGIKPEAIRVALHRLRKDNWLQSKRDGRSSLYQLTPMGRAETQAASPRIYHPIGLPAEAWVVISRSGDLPSDGYTVASNVTIAPSRPSGDSHFATLLPRKAALPEWINDRLFEPTLINQTQEAAMRLERLHQHVLAHPMQDAVNIAIARVLTVHIWRRIALKVPNLPEELFPTAWAGFAAQKAAHDILGRLPAPPIADLEDALGRS